MIFSLVSRFIPRSLLAVGCKTSSGSLEFKYIFNTSARFHCQDSRILQFFGVYERPSEGAGHHAVHDEGRFQYSAGSTRKRLWYIYLKSSIQTIFFCVQVISDFDMTLTRFAHNGKRCPTCHSKFSIELITTSGVKDLKVVLMLLLLISFVDILDNSKLISSDCRKKASVALIQCHFFLAWILCSINRISPANWSICKAVVLNWWVADPFSVGCWPLEGNAKKKQKKKRHSCLNSRWW